MQTIFSERLARLFVSSRFFLLAFVLLGCRESFTPTTSPALTRPLPTLTAFASPSPLMLETETPTPTRAPISFDATATPQPTPFGAPPPPPASDTNIYFQEVALVAYPYETFLFPATDAQTNVSFFALDRDAYEKAHKNLGTTQKIFRAVVLENRYLKLTFLPELGGRLYQITYKPTNQNLLYNNRVLKPSPWGLSAQKGWLAAGGIEWAFPTQEHGYEWNAAWQFETNFDDNAATITLRDSDAADRPRVRIRVTLRAQTANFEIETRVENPTAQPQRVQFWNNAMLNLGAHEISPNTEFIFPSDSVFVHSTGNEWIPQEFVPPGARHAAAPVSFSNLNGRDLRWYKNWDVYLGVFAAQANAKNLATNFVGAYNHTTALGIARVFPPEQAPGVKLFAFGPNFCCRDLYTDDGSGYFEMWGGIPRTFFPEDDVTLAPNETRAWTETWLPFARTNGLLAASADAAISLRVEKNQAFVSIASARAREAVLVLKQNGEIVQTRPMSLTPQEAWSEQFPIAGGAIQVQLQDAQGNLIVETK